MSMSSPRLTDYTIVVEPSDGMWVAYAPAILGCHAQGDTPEEARSELDGVFEMITELFADEGIEFPADFRELIAVAG